VVPNDLRWPGSWTSSSAPTRVRPGSKSATAGSADAGWWADCRKCGVTTTIAATTWHDMNLPPDQPSPGKPKLTSEERRARHADRLTTIRLRMLIGRELEDRGITTPAAIGKALGMPAAEATKLLTRHQWREGDVALLQAAAMRLGVQAPGP
jgi:hypothetical protein